ncbi:MAG: capsule assembly Wzi family protein [Elusimicrobia bacterium]|nr:capsule assembly Wzi family protein [Elusimicrobiota bacterium]
MRYAIFLPLLFTPALLQAQAAYKAIDTVTSKIYYAPEPGSFIEGRDGLKFAKGLNIFMFEDGWWTPGSKLIFYYSFKQTVSPDKTVNKVFRAYGRYSFSKFSIEAGKDNINLGPGKYGILLSNNAEPFLLIKLQTEQSLRFAGLWDFVMLNGWLNEKRLDTTNPKIFLVRIGWQPAGWLELAGTRNTMYGGAGRPEYKIWEYPALFFGKDENTSGGRFDNDGYVGWDATIHLPAEKWSGGALKTAKLYYSDNGTDIRAFWQKEDRGMKYYFPFGFRFMLTAYIGGIYLETEKDAFRLEFMNTNPLFYTHHWYSWEGYTYKGMSLGEPYGRNIIHAFFTQRHKLNDTSSFEYTLGWLQQPAFKAKDENTLPLSMKRYYLTLSGSKRYDRITIEPYLRLDKTRNYDTDPLPTQYNIISKDKTFLTVGASATYKF